MPKRSPQELAQQARERIARIRHSLTTLEYLCSGTLLARMKTCGKPACLCAQDPAARHGPYYEWGYIGGRQLS